MLQTSNLLNYFSPKHVYVKFKNAKFCNKMLLFFTHEKMRYIGLYFPRNFITLEKCNVVMETLNRSENYMTIIFDHCAFLTPLMLNVTHFLAPLMLNVTLISMDFC